MMEKTILIVDEATRTRGLLASILSMKGYEVFESGNGRAALELIPGLQPDLIIVEALLPAFSGFEFCAALRRDPDFQHIPTLMMCALTGNLARRNDNWRDHIPADDLITRPFGLQDLMLRVEKLLGAIPETRALSS
jgi:DNA-binding response OmpR family regulator